MIASIFIFMTLTLLKSLSQFKKLSFNLGLYFFKNKEPIANNKAKYKENFPDIDKNKKNK